MISAIIHFSVRNKLIIILATFGLILGGIYSISEIPIGAVPDITNNQVQIITTSRNLSTQDIEQFITYPVELEMANLPGVKEIRSISKFGLSVVTVVFEDDMGTYLPRQLIAEKIKSASEQIPEGFGSPEMAPITTGLGEIYQYVLDTKPGYDSVYSITDLRTIQDWVVKRQLSGISGVVEVNTWGGYLKQYEVAVNPERLKAMNTTISEVFTALQENNDVTGGGYIEKSQKSYFVRGEGMVKSLDDMQKIVVKTENGIPVYIRDVATVQFGNATRFGAITGNGEGEKVMGQIMMLKGASSSDVINRVKDRIAEVQEALPEGVVINPFLERTELINKTTHTIAENLILGALIVIFVVVLLLGNLRSGLIVASVIPLSLMFGISMMNIFNVQANLMSLGAIDFGIIIDGAVIIVEFAVFQMTRRQSDLIKLTGQELKDKKDEIVLDSANKMMRSAIFGQIIILIVFIPILSLSNIEGKMFGPMGQSFSFTLIGAMILCLTYIPVMSSIFLKPEKERKKGIGVSQRIMNAIQWVYTPVIRFALKKKVLVLASALLLFVTSVVIFIRMGGEFIPTLDEGDYVIQPVLKTGTSLGQTIDMMTKMEQILRDSFPEVDQVVTRIGAAEVPTDPMSMEETDVIVKLRPPDEWVHAETKEDLANKMKEALSIIPGVDYEFTQPIEMRFNELVTGVRSDVAIKIFGEDLDKLYGLGNDVKKLISDVQGAADITVEKIAGLPQMSVSYDRDKVAQYGLNISELNRIVRTAFAGEPAGVVFEGEKRFDLVVRLENQFRKDIDNLENLYIDLPNHQQIPLKEVADISYKTGPAKISRDDTKRRIVIGINVRNRDVESLVEEIRGILDENLQLPTGYTITYGGQFENLQNAKDRLVIAVPVSLLLIFIMLYFTFNSIKEAFLVYSAIPLSAIGGVILLWMRDLPFSISAGVGFIALFGIAVLNGIVLIDCFNELKEDGIEDLNERIISGTRLRLRPVLLTASAAALGFFPMAFSASAGAEVQRPLATVVIGGLVTATLLTLVVLPTLYAIFEERIERKKLEEKQEQKRKSIPFGFLGAILVLITLSFSASAQTKVIDLEEALNLAVENNAGLQANQLQVIQQEKLQKTSFDPGKTTVFHSYDENNIAANGTALKVFGVQQTISFPSVYGVAGALNKRKVNAASSNYQLNQMIVKKQVTLTYYEILYLLNKYDQITYLDSLYARFAQAASRRYELGETNYLEKITAEAKQQELAMQMKQTEADINAQYELLQGWLQAEDSFRIEEVALEKISVTNTDFAEVMSNHSGIQYFESLKEVSDAELKLERNKLLPDLQAEYFVGRSQGENAQNYDGYRFGIAIPLWVFPQSGRAQAAAINKEVTENEAENYRIKLEAKFNELSSMLNKNNEAIIYYENQGSAMANEIINTAEKSYQAGEIGYINYIQSLESARQIQMNFLDNMNQYNQTVIRINYLTLE